MSARTRLLLLLVLPTVTLAVPLAETRAAASDGGVSASPRMNCTDSDHHVDLTIHNDSDSPGTVYTYVSDFGTTFFNPFPPIEVAAHTTAVRRLAPLPDKGEGQALYFFLGPADQGRQLASLGLACVRHVQATITVRAGIPYTRQVCPGLYVTGARHGTLKIWGGHGIRDRFTYTANRGFVGTEDLVYTCLPGFPEDGRFHLLVRPGLPALTAPPAGAANPPPARAAPTPRQPTGVPPVARVAAPPRRAAATLPSTGGPVGAEFAAGLTLIGLGSVLLRLARRAAGAR
jgi:hypothetical protein